MEPLEGIAGTIAIAQAIAGTCKVIDICITKIKHSKETLDRWNQTSISLHQIAEQFEVTLLQRRASALNEGSPEDKHYEVISDQLSLFHKDLQELQKNLEKPTLVNSGSNTRLSLRSKLKLASAMNWRRNEELFKWIERHINFISVNCDLIKAVNDHNMSDVQKVLGNGHASHKTAQVPGSSNGTGVEPKGWLESAENFATQIALRELDPSDGDTLAPNETEWDMIQDTPPTTNIDTVSAEEREYRLQATLHQVDQLEDLENTVIAAIVQLEAIHLKKELYEARGLSISFKKMFPLQERYVQLLSKSTEKHNVFGTRAQDYLRDHIVPCIDCKDIEQQDIWLSVGKMYFTLKVWEPAVDWLRLALLNGYLRDGAETDCPEIAEVSKQICQIYEIRGHPQNAIALKQRLVRQLGREPTKVAGDLETVAEWCRLKGFGVLIEGDHLVFTRQLNSKGNSALHEAALEGVTDVNILSKLIANDLLVLKNLSGDTALLLAVDKSNTHLIPNLLNMPSLLHVRDSEDRTPFHRCRDPEVLGLLLDGLNRSRHRSSLTHVERNSHEASSLVDVNSRDIYGKTALYMACAQGNLKMMREFINAGADVNIADKTERCPILAFSTCIPSASKDRMILRLRVKGADPDREDIDGNTARKELQRLSSTKTVNKLLSLDPAVELERLETRSRAERRESNASSSTTRSNISFAGLFS